MTSKDLLAHFGISGSVSDRAGLLMRAAGSSENYAVSSEELGDAGLLVSTLRRNLMQSRERALTEE